MLKNYTDEPDLVTGPEDVDGSDFRFPDLVFGIGVSDELGATFLMVKRSTVVGSVPEAVG